MHLPTAAFPNLDGAQACEWLDALAPNVHSPGSHTIGHEVWARLAKYYQQQNLLAEAEAILLRGLAAGYPDTLQYEGVLALYLKDDHQYSIRRPQARTAMSYWQSG